MLQTTRATVRPGVNSRTPSVAVRAQQQQTRRSLLGLLATGVAAGAAALVPQEAQAIKIASQDFTGGMVRGGGNTTKSGSLASTEGYTLEGTKKSGITPKRKAKLLARTREEAVASSVKAAPAPAAKK